MKREVCNPVTHAPPASSPISLCCGPFLPAVPDDCAHWALRDGGHRNPHGGHDVFVFGYEMARDGEVIFRSVLSSGFLRPLGVKAQRENH